MPTCHSNIVKLSWRSWGPGDLGILDVKAPDPGEDCEKLTLGPVGSWFFFLAWGAYIYIYIYLVANGEVSIQSQRGGLQWGVYRSVITGLGPSRVLT